MLRSRRFGRCEDRRRLEDRRVRSAVDQERDVAIQARRVRLVHRHRFAQGEKFWVDRGWIVAGKDALTAPVIPKTPAGKVEITGRLRLDTSLPRGSFFALPASGSGLISKWNAQNEVVTEGFYLDLLNGSTADLTPRVSAQLPELSDGPHMAYALQWVFFAGLVGYGRFLIRRSR